MQYSPAGRITGFTKTTAANAPVDSATFSYDANGNRTASTRDVAGSTASRTYGGDASHNRLLGFEQTVTAGSNSASTSVTYQYNSAGDLLGDGLTTYRYDSEGRMESASTGQGEDAPTTKYAHNGLGQRVFKTEPLYASSTSTGNPTGKNLNNLLADDDEPQGEPPGLIQQILNFFSKLWSPSTSDAEKLGFSYVYAEDGSLLGEYGSGGSNSTGTAQYIYLPTASGPMPIAAVIKGQTYAIHSDHLNTPRKLTQPDGQVAWQWAYSAFGDEQPTLGAKRFTSESTNPTTGATSIPEVTLNLRYPGQYFDKETKLHYNYFRTYAPSTGRYTQGDPIGLDGGWNRFGYAANNPLQLSDPSGLCIGPLLAPCLWVASNAPWLITASTAATSFGYAYINGAAPAIAPATARLTNVARAIQEGVGSGAYCAANRAQNITNGPRLAQQLALNEAASIFTNGALRADVIAGSKVAIPGSQLNNPALINALTVDGSKIADWAKMTTQTYNSPSGPFQAHFYQNLKTGATHFTDDFKAVFNHNGNWP